MTQSEQILCAIDSDDAVLAGRLVEVLKGYVAGIKIGSQFFTANGPSAVRAFLRQGMPVFLDLKFHDIPNTVAGAVAAACALGPRWMTVHAGGGAAMIKAAVDAASQQSTPPMIIAVTTLTSLDDVDLHSLGINGGVKDHTMRLAELAVGAGVGGLVCSPHEVTVLRRHFGEDITIICPGIRLPDDENRDQKRVMSYRQAIANGANYAVVGRSITAQADLVAAVRRLVETA